MTAISVLIGQFADLLYVFRERGSGAGEDCNLNQSKARSQLGLPTQNVAQGQRPGQLASGHGLIAGMSPTGIGNKSMATSVIHTATGRSMYYPCPSPIKGA